MNRIIWIILFLFAGPPGRADSVPAPELRELAQRIQPAATSAIPGRDGWLFFTPEIRHMAAGQFWGDAAAAVSRANRPDAADPLPAILAFHQALRERGIALVMVPVPAKAAVYPDKLAEPLTEAGVATVHARFYDLLRGHDIIVLDLLPVFRAQRDHPRGPLYCRRDTHWSGTGCVVAAEQIAATIRAYLDPERLPRTFDAEWVEIEIDGDLARMLDPPAEPERLMVRKVTTADAETPEPVAPDPQSPVVLLGDSHALVFHAGGDMYARGAGLADQLALELGQPVDLVAVRGSGATPARINLFRRAQRDPGYWDGKRVLVWCFSVRELTESDGWRSVPIAP